MKVVIFALPNNVSDEEIIALLANLSATINIEIKGTILSQKDLEPTSRKTKVESKFINAVKLIMKTFGDIVHSVSDRAEFYHAVVNKTVEKPILEIIAFGPKDGIELNALKDAGGQEFITICRTALSLVDNL